MAETAPNLNSAANALATDPSIGKAKAPVAPQESQPQQQPKTEGREAAPSKTPSARRLLKDNNQEIEVDEETFERLAHKGFGAEKRFREAHQLRQEAQAQMAKLEQERAKLEEIRKVYGEDSIEYAIQQAKNDPEKAKRLRERVENYLVEQIQLEQASPEQQAYMREKARAEALERKIKDAEEHQKKAEFEKQKETYRQQFTETIVKALEASNVPKTERAVKAMADMMRIAKKSGINVSPEQIAEHVKEEIRGEVQNFGGEMTTRAETAFKAKDWNSLNQISQDLLYYYGEPLIKAVRYCDIAKLNSQKPNVPAPAVATPQVQKENKHQRPQGYKMSYAEMQEEARRRAEALQRGEAVPEW